MKTLFLITCLIFIGAFLNSCSENSKRLTSDELSELFSRDKRADFITLRYNGSVSFQTDNSANLSIPALGEDDGVWRLENDKICIKWNEALQNTEQCAHLELKEDGSFLVRNPATNVSLGSFIISD